MTDYFLGEIRIFPYNFAPKDWAMCNGQTLAIAQYTALFSLLGTTFGGNGVTTFQLPDLRSRIPLHQGTGTGLDTYVLGELAGVEEVTLIETQMPKHTHAVAASSASATDARPGGAVPARVTSPGYASTSDGTVMNSAMIENAGGNLPFAVLQPYLVLTFCISLVGIFPVRS